MHTIAGMSVFGGGPSLSTLLTVTGLRQQGVSASVLTYAPSKPGDSLISSAPYIHVLDARPDARMAYSPAYKRKLWQLAADADVLHAQGVWQYPSHAAAVVARQGRKPYVISLRGMLYPQALRSSAWVKRLSMALYQRSDLRHAACIHATCGDECGYYRRLGMNNPVAIIPNPINVDVAPAAPAQSVQIGYLGRLHPRKRVERLIYALARQGGDARGCRLVIIGGGDEAYEAFLRGEAQRLLPGRVDFTGFLSGKAKEEALQSLSYLFVPSDFENFGNIVLEALVRGIPVAAGKGTPWEELNTHRCGWWIDNDVDTLAATMHEAMVMPPSEREAMGRRGRQLVIDNYSVDVVAAKMKSVYEWLLGAPKPSCVYE